MSLDDQLFKQDGTLLTRVDIALLKFSRFVANFFLEEDEETYTPVLKRLVNAGSLIYAVAAVGFVCSGAVGSAIGICCVTGGLNHLSATKQIERGCTGEGTNIMMYQKASAIFLLLVGPLLLPLNLLLTNTDFRRAGAALFVAILAYSMHVFAAFYVKRLNNVPPKKKKVKETKLAVVPGAA